VNSSENDLSRSEYSDHKVLRTETIFSVIIINRFDFISCDTSNIIVIIISSKCDVNLLDVSAKWQLSNR
jgi:hypothetical protein